MIDRLHWGSIGTALCLAMVIGGTGSQTVAQEEPPGDGLFWPHPVPAYIPPGEVVWDKLYEIGSGPERVAVVVWHDPAQDPPDGLYGLLQSSIDAYAFDVARAGFTVAVIKFYGMAADPLADQPEEKDLRDKLLEMWSEPQSLAGAVLVGNVQYLLFERDQDPDPEEYDFIDFASDTLIADLDGTISDTLDEDDGPPGTWRAGVFDAWDPGGDQQEMEIWISRIMARPALVQYFGRTQEEILAEYFARNHTGRWSAFNTSGEALWYACDVSDVLPPVEALLQELFYDVKTVCPASGTYPCQDGSPSWNDYVTARLPHGYAHIHLHACHGGPYYHRLPHPPAGPDAFRNVYREHYTSADPQSLSYVFESCYNCDYAFAGASVGEVVTFNPDAVPTLVAFGGSKGIHARPLFYTYYSVLPQGRCIGEGYKELFNVFGDPPDDGALGYVMLGDGTLKRWGEIVEWVSDGSSHTTGSEKGVTCQSRRLAALPRQNSIGMPHINRSQ